VLLAAFAVNNGFADEVLPQVTQDNYNVNQADQGSSLSAAASLYSNWFAPSDVSLFLYLK
jgi:hypothetical protein